MNSIVTFPSRVSKLKQMAHSFSLLGLPVSLCLFSSAGRVLCTWRLASACVPGFVHAVFFPLFLCFLDPWKVGVGVTFGVAGGLTLSCEESLCFWKFDINFWIIEESLKHVSNHFRYILILYIHFLLNRPVNSGRWARFGQNSCKKLKKMEKFEKVWNWSILRLEAFLYIFL